MFNDPFGIEKILQKQTLLKRLVCDGCFIHFTSFLWHGIITNKVKVREAVTKSIKAVRSRQGNRIHVCVTPISYALPRDSALPVPLHSALLSQKQEARHWAQTGLWGTGDGPRDGIRLHSCIGLCPRVKKTESRGNSSQKEERERMEFRDVMQDGSQDLPVRARRFTVGRLGCSLGEGPEACVTHRCFVRPSYTSPS